METATLPPNVVVIESDWRETPLDCPQCGGVMYTDGKHRPQCG